MTPSEFKSIVAAGERSQSDLAALYEREVFPAALARMRDFAVGAMKFDILYLTAGTQPFSQALSIAATPAEKVVFIATDDPKCQESLRRAIELAGLAESQYEIHTFPEPFSVEDMTKEIYFHASTCGKGHLAADITSGRKVMSAALSSIASELEIQQFYLHAEYLRGGFAVNERRMHVPSVAALVRYLEQEDADTATGEEV